MYRYVSKLLVYRSFEKNSILMNLADITEEYDHGNYRPEELTGRILDQIHALLDISTQYGFEKNLWHNYLAYLIATTEVPFALTCEKTGAQKGCSINKLATNDFAIFKKLFDYDFSPMERALGIDCFSTISDYRSVEKQERNYNKNVSEKVRALSEQIEQAQTPEQIFEIVTRFYQAYGVGMFGLNKAFRVAHDESGVRLTPITNTDVVRLDDLIGYEIQKKKLIDNTEAFVQGRRANNCLLFGDAGTGKSTSIKAILNQYYDQGLRMIEIFKHQFQDLSTVISMIKNRNYRFIIYMDDLSFEEFEVEYKYLKAVIEGGLETKPDNVLIYATSNRRHLIRETWDDRSDMAQNELHRSDTMQEKLSLVARFGITISYMKPSQNEFFEIVKGLAHRYPEIHLTDEELCYEANKWELAHGGVSGRTAQQFINYLAGQKND